MGALQLVQLQQVLDLTQEPVGRAQVARVVASDVAARGQRGQGRERGRAAQRLVGAAVHELEELHGELDVAQPARAELDLPARAAGSVFSTRRRMACTSSTKRSRWAACQTIGASASTYSCPSAMSPAAGRAFSSAWNSHVLAQRS